MQRLLAPLTWLAFPVYVWQGLGVRRRTTRMLPARGPVLHEVPGKAPPVALLVLGDSFMQGIYLNEENTPPERLRAYLQGELKTRTAVLCSSMLFVSA